MNEPADDTAPGRLKNFTENEIIAEIIAVLAEKEGIQVVPHSANLNLVTIFSVHLLGAILNSAPYLEYTIEHDSAINQEAKKLYSPQLEVTDGAVSIPAEPGWGVKIHQDWMEEAEYQKSEL